MVWLFWVSLLQAAGDICESDECMLGAFVKVMEIVYHCNFALTMSKSDSNSNSSSNSNSQQEGQRGAGATAAAFYAAS